MSILGNVKKHITKYNFNVGSLSRIKYIVVHYVGSTGSAKANCEYYASGDVGASAHYFVDFNGDVYQSVEDKNVAWHCGSKSPKHPLCRNSNSIGIEMCCKTTGDKTKADNKWYFEDATVAATIELVKELMNKYHIPATNVIRHYDVTGKTCPAPYVFNNGKHTWAAFKEAITKTSSSVSPSRTDSSIEKKAWDMFIKAGFSKFAAAGWLANIKAESAFKANNMQNCFEGRFNDSTYTANIDSKKYTKAEFIKDKIGYGLAQWTFWSRKEALYEYVVEKKKKSIGDAISQLEFMIKEIKSDFSGLVNKLKKCKSAAEASDLILEMYEAPAVKNYDTRRKYAKEYYDKYAATVSSASTPVGNKTMTAADCPFMVRIKANDLNIRTSPNGKKTGKYTGTGTFTIVDVVNGWGLLKAYASSRNGWICLEYATRV